MPNFTSSVTLEENALIRKVAWRLMPLMMVSYFFAFFDRINIGFAKSQLQLDIGLSNTAYGLGASAFVVGYVIFEIPSSVMLYRTGARQWIARIMFSWGLATAAMMFIREPWHFYGLRFLVGALEAGFGPGALYYLSIWFPTSHRGRITSYFFIASAFSGIIGGPLAGLILGQLNGVLGLAGWQWLFLFGGLPCVVLGIVLFIFLDSRIEEARWLSDNEKQLLSTSIARVGPGQRGHTLLQAIRTPGVLLLCLVYFLIQIASYGLNFWGPDLIRTASGGRPELVGVLSAAPYLCGAVMMVIIGRVADRTGERRRYVIACLVAASAGFSLAAFADARAGLMVLALSVIGGAVVSCIPTFWSLPPKLLAGVGTATGFALINSLGQMGGIVSPVLIGRIKDLTGSATPALFVIAALCLICAALLYFTAPAALRANEHAP